ncbi:hypothetical protein N431DRAFT_549382 [Stipitochalara longipes BDJ]|nr:hypothetical protein N431DRAFT_549382 [Stipitochalara longipes BDJ]
MRAAIDMDIPSEAAKLRRVGHPKARTGCLVCKARKVKCDETQPQCYRCKALDFACRYPPPKAPKQSSLSSSRSTLLIPIVPRLSSLALTPNPSSSIPGNESERRYFQLFQDRLSSEFCGYFASPFWTQVILQECHHNPAVRHAIFALSALYKASESRTNIMRADDEHLDFALVQQSKAIGSFRKGFSEVEEYRQVRLALLASMLFGCFESFYGNWKAAAQQISSGLRLFEQWERTRRSKPASRGEAIDPQLGVTLARLDLQMECYLALHPMNDNPVTELQSIPLNHVYPARFTTLAEAFPSALELSTSGVRHTRNAFRSLNLGSNLDVLERERDSIHSFIRQWKKAFRPILLERETGQYFGNRDSFGILQLYACVVGFEILLVTSLSKEEMIYDGYTDQFRQIVSVCRRLCEMDRDWDRRSRQIDYLKAQFGLGVLMSIYVVATRCREPSIRRDAIATLREWPSKNGIWDSLHIAQVAEWIMGIEEEMTCGNNSTIPEEARVRMSSLKVTTKREGIDVECIQGYSDQRVRTASIKFS